MQRMNFIIVLFVAWTAAAYSAELRPVDEAAKNPSFREFRSQLLRAVEQKDRGHLFGVLAPDIRNSFGGNDGKDAFAEQWKLDSTDSEVWKELKWILTHGGSFFEDGSFCAPYVYSRWPDNYDAFEYAAVVSDRLPVRKSRSAASAVVGRLRYTIVKVLDEQWSRAKPGELIKVQANSIVGFVPAGTLRSSPDWRACFAKQEKGWLMTMLVAGD